MAYLEMRNITKRFGVVTANADVNLSVEKGSIHALLGENGAGKSTLMNILYGVYTQTDGEILLDGEPLRITDSKDAIAKGICMVHQHFMLIPTLTVIENVVLGHPDQRGVLDLKAAAARFCAMAKEYNMELDPFAPVSKLTVGQQQRLEILKALYRNCKLLILDEPTAVLTPAEAEDLFAVMRKLTADGHTIIFISHKLGEITEICDHCSILRQGRMVGSMAVSDIRDHSQLASLMVGHEVELVTKKADATPGERILEVRDLNYQSSRNLRALSDISFHIDRGEILGVCGVDGNGQSELVQCITGLLKKGKTGTITLKGRNILHQNPRAILRGGVCHVPEDRRKMGMIGPMNLAENFMLMTYKSRQLSRFGFLKLRAIRKKANEVCRGYQVKMAGISDTAQSLSGGNQQKLVVGRELDRSPDLLIAVHPDRGLDIGATKYIQEQIVRQRDRGAAVLLVSAELDEILSLSDRIIVMNGGRIAGALTQKEATRQTLGLLMAGGAPEPATTA